MSSGEGGEPRNPGAESIGSRPNVITTPEGFKINGRNETSTIRSLEAFNGTPIPTLQDQLRPREYSGRLVLLGYGESLLDVWGDDNDLVERMETSHQVLGDFLATASTAEAEQRVGSYSYIEVKGKKLARKVDYGPTLTSPLTGKSSDETFTIVDLQTGTSISYSGLQPAIIYGYGLYGSEASGNRVDPNKIAEIAGPPQPDDPVAQLAHDTDAAVRITTAEQVSRVNNLVLAGVNILNGSNYTVAPEDLPTLLQLCHVVENSGQNDLDDEEPADITPFKNHVSTRIDPGHITPGPYQMKKRGRLLTETLPTLFPQLQTVALQAITELQLPDAKEEDTPIAVQLFLEKTLEGASGPDDSQKAYYEGLLQKLPHDSQTVQQLYDAAARLTQPERTVLDDTLPTLKADIITEYKALGLNINDDVPLETLIAQKAQIDENRRQVTEATAFVRSVGGITEAQPYDIGKFFGILQVVQADPKHNFTSEERAIMARLHVDEKVLPYANGFSSLFNGAAEGLRMEEEAPKLLPDNVDDNARTALRTIIKLNRRNMRNSPLDQISIGELVQKVTERAAVLQADGEAIGQTLSVTGEDVVAAYAGLVAPEFRELFENPVITKSFSEAGAIVKLTVDPEVFAELPEAVIPNHVYGDEHYRTVTTGDKTYYIDVNYLQAKNKGIIVGEPPPNDWTTEEKKARAARTLPIQQYNGAIMFNALRRQQ